MFGQQAAVPTAGTSTFTTGVPAMDSSSSYHQHHSPADVYAVGGWGGHIAEAVAVPLEPTPTTPPDIKCILEKSHKVWLKGEELLKVLEYGASGGFPMSAAAADTPPGGTLFLFDRRRTRFFRLDGHNWRKKSDGKTTRETHEKIKVDNVERLNCYYAHAVEPFLLQRRCYWLLDDDRVVLVHYLQTDAGRKRTADRWNELLRQGLATGEIGADGCPAMPTPSNSGASGMMMKRRRSSAESSRLSDPVDYAGYYSQPDSQRVSLEELSRRRHSSMEDSRDAFSLPHQHFRQSWHPMGGWAALETSALQHHNSSSSRGSPSPALPWLSLDHMLPDGMLPWDGFAQAAPTLSSLPAPTVARHDNVLPSGNNSFFVEQQHSNVPSNMESYPQPEPVDRFYIQEISQHVVRCHGGETVLIRGTPSAVLGTLLRGGAYVDVDGACCSISAVEPGMVSFVTPAHPVGPATLVLRDASGQSINGARTNLFYT